MCVSNQLAHTFSNNLPKNKHKIKYCLKSTYCLVRWQKAKKGPEVEVEYVQTFIAVYWS